MISWANFQGAATTIPSLRVVRYAGETKKEQDGEARQNGRREMSRVVRPRDLYSRVPIVTVSWTRLRRPFLDIRENEMGKVGLSGHYPVDTGRWLSQHRRQA